MKTFFYPHLAFQNIKRNKMLYLPYICTCIAMVMMYYIVIFIRYNGKISLLTGSGSALNMLMAFGGAVIFVFSGIFLFYTNSFLIKRRQRELGLYNVLGMGKSNIINIVIWENIFIACISLICGIFFGIVFSKLAELGLIKIINAQVDYDLNISLPAVIQTILVYTVIFVLLLFNFVIKILKNNTIDLINSDSYGEKEPKSNCLLAVGGLIVLIVAYSIAVQVKNPIESLVFFFYAVILVIIATYMLMISGSVYLCKLLRNIKSYYYKPEHFINVSIMNYRMKKNGASLASICIITTMVLVILSSTATLYAAKENSIKSILPREINVELRGYDRNSFLENISGITKILDENSYIDKYAYVWAYDDADYSYKGIGYDLYCIDLATYNRLSGQNEKLDSDEVLISFYSPYSIKDWREITVTNKIYHVEKIVDKFVENSEAAKNISNTVFVVVDDLNNLDQDLLIYHYTCGFNLSSEVDEKIVIKNINKQFSAMEFDENITYKITDRNSESAAFYGIYGGLFYIGIILSIVFIGAAVLMIYYKQIVEGYEDQRRFIIMQQVGLDKKDIRKCINRQLLIIFFLPLLLSGLHLTFAFPMIDKILVLFNTKNLPLEIAVTIMCFVVYAIFYILIYRFTSNVYYHLVSVADEQNI
ncbi:MAG: ABC transporter permease [Erysipelotrichia bacterium]|nr:ABC transporter permease [Erysipelotrichia bacterium]